MKQLLIGLTLLSSIPSMAANYCSIERYGNDDIAVYSKGIRISKPYFTRSYVLNDLYDLIKKGFCKKPTPQLCSFERFGNYEIAVYSKGIRISEPYFTRSYVFDDLSTLIEKGICTK